ncbi:hypothetical protein LJC33_00410 [Eubacteriales bacterium OttesenSCG-928-N13]|nr:hypothetical protein [Eubacteriales bacterium OttesenSCG-928-N13]
MTKLKTGNELFTYNGQALKASLLDFWRWHGSNLLSNIYRGALAEFVVAQALRIDFTMPRDGWMAYDLVTNDGIKVEVKSSAYLQEWAQKRPSTIQFSIAPARAALPDGTYDDSSVRQADVYVFCILCEESMEKVNPLSLDQWMFYVASTKLLDEIFGTQKSIRLSSLKKVATGPIAFSGLRNAVEIHYAYQTA